MWDRIQQRDDTDLVASIVLAERDALEELYRRHGGASVAVARHVTGDPAHAEDVVQDVFLRLWERPDRFDAQRGTLRAFLMVETHSRSVDRVRREDARRRHEEREARSDPGRHEPELDVRMWEEVVGEHLQAAIETLTDGERSAVEVAYFGGNTYRETAALLGEPEGTIKSRIRSGLHRLQQELCVRGITRSWLET